MEKTLVELYNELDPGKREAAVKFLASRFNNMQWAALAYMMRNKDWLVINRFHMTIGMHVRNELRMNGFSEAELGVENLDSYYGQLLFKAAQYKGLFKGESNGN